MRKHVFQVEMAHKTYGRNYSSYTVTARSAQDAIYMANKKAALGEYAFEVKHIATLD